MFRTLSGKLVAALLALLLLASFFYISLTVFTTRLHLQEVDQKLNQTLAANIVKEHLLMRDKQVNNEALKALFHSLMVINPSIEVYLIGLDGEIIAYSAPPGKVKRKRISLDPIASFLSGAATFPIFGDDPRNPNRKKVFSAAAIEHEGRMEGYLYVVLGGEAFDTVTQMFQGSYIFRLSAGMTAAVLVLILAAGVLSFLWLTRRLRRLAASMNRFNSSDFQEPATTYHWRQSAPADEIDQLGFTFERMAQRIIDQVQQLKQADATRREMVANVSHDLRTPLASLQCYLETLQLKQETLSDKQKSEYIQSALKHSQRLSRLIEELFELATLEARDAKLSFEPFALNELVHDVAQKFNLEADKKKLRFTTDIPEEVPFVFGDIGLIERVLDNLIENAIKYTPEGGGIRLSLVPGRDQITARVADTGPGIPQEDIPRIFDRFYRVEKHHPNTPEGTGLGLAITKRILQLHGSPIEVDSAIGAGASFTFSLPVYKA